MDAGMLIPESGLEQEGQRMTTTPVETMVAPHTSKPWGTSWYSEERKKTNKQKKTYSTVINKTNTFFNDNSHIYEHKNT